MLNDSGLVHSAAICRSGQGFAKFRWTLSGKTIDMIPSSLSIGNQGIRIEAL